MNRKQRDQNRTTAGRLAYFAATCPECAGRGKHAVFRPYTLADAFSGRPREVLFWTCAKFYGPDGSRLPDAAYQDEDEIEFLMGVSE